MSSRVIRRACLIGMGLLFALSVPWYREAGAAPRLWLGLPDWVTLALGCYALAAVLNFVAWHHTEVEAAEVDDEEPR